MKIILISFLSFIGFALTSFLLLLTFHADFPWWGLVHNPSSHDKSGVTFSFFQLQGGSLNGDFQEFIHAKKRLPTSFKELDYFIAKKRDLPPEKIAPGKIIIDSAHIKSYIGYDTDSLSVHYSDGSRCLFHITNKGYTMECSMRDWWHNGKLIQQKTESVFE